MTETKKQQKRKKNGKDYSSVVGEKFGMLTILEVLPRERDSCGVLKPPQCLCRCECGNIRKRRLYDVVYLNVLSCGCIRGQHGVDRNESTPSSIVEALSAVYYCNYPTGICVRSKLHRLCCHECDRFSGCSQACKNTPEKCKAPLRDDLEKEDYEGGLEDD